MRLLINTRPQEIEIDLRSSAVVVVDMQNAFASKGGMFDLSGIDISGSSRVIDKIRDILPAAREAGVQVVFLQMGYKPDHSDTGGPDSPNWHKETALLLMRNRRELRQRLITQGTWDYAIVDVLRPEPGDMVVAKSRYSGFAATKLDSLLRDRDVRYLFFAGIATNVCVESTLRDAYFLEYWPILITDATMQAGPEVLKLATIQNVENFFGWTLNSKDLINNLKNAG